MTRGTSVAVAIAAKPPFPPLNLLAAGQTLLFRDSNRPGQISLVSARGAEWFC